MGDQTPTHLIVFVHGLGGSYADLRQIADEFQSKLGGSVRTHLAAANSKFFHTLDGVEKGGIRLADEVIHVASTVASVKYVSFVSHSLGGLYSRYCIGILYERSFFDSCKPGFYISLATPHLGVRRPKRGLFNPLFSWVSKTFVGKSGKDLNLEDEQVDHLPVLLTMTRGPFIEGLKLFHGRMVYSNIQHDIQVPYSTGAILPGNPYRVRDKPLVPADPTYPHIIRVSQHDGHSTDALQKRAFEGDAKAPYLREMLENLLSLTWTRVDVKFAPILSHEQIAHKRSVFSFFGDDIMHHIVEQGVKMSRDVTS